MENKNYRNAVTQRGFARQRLDLLTARQVAGLDLTTGLKPAEVLRAAELTYAVKDAWVQLETGRKVDLAAVRAAIAAEALKSDSTPAFQRRIAELESEAAERLIVV